MYNSEGKKYLIDYPGNINLSIEKAYRNKDKEVRFMDDGGTEFAIDFYHMEEYPTFNKSDVTIVTRRDKIKGVYDYFYFLCTKTCIIMIENIGTLY